MKILKPALTLYALFTLLTGVVYPLGVTLLGSLLFPTQARGDAAWLIGQEFSDPRYFWGRLSATGPTPYNAGASSGSNLGPLNAKIFDAATSRLQALGPARPVPVDLVTASGSGLDPHISPEAARYQVARVASARQMDPAAVQQLVEACIEGRQLGLLGQPRVNVLQLNQALDRDEPEAPAK
ncbi:potassium-transporting ATPase subunit KdpC [bacterium CPR1]|nr:potassium-transporting ATPase subunit KdpC [bacterium CPR1]